VIARAKNTRLFIPETGADVAPAEADLMAPAVAGEDAAGRCDDAAEAEKGKYSFAQSKVRPQPHWFTASGTGRVLGPEK